MLEQFSNTDATGLRENGLARTIAIGERTVGHAANRVIFSDILLNTEQAGISPISEDPGIFMPLGNLRTRQGNR
jgi:hypothetical protein